ncbi:acrEF/envCD operon transcriptional regulator [Huaxiibacter chinensis]|uniref:acrEF/envCD operon transcriptional regulator n=1 Tax=Huaxiibacter chinensis TaxID=2899785 RepID=UPI003F9A13F8
MVRKTKADAYKTRQLLIETAITQFALRGVASTTLTDIAQAAGLTRGAVYWHFTCKSALFNAIWREQLPLGELIKDRLVLQPHDDPLQMLREKFITALQYIARDPRQRSLMQILYHKCEFDNDMISEHDIRQRIGFNYENVRLILKKCLSQGVISPAIDIDLALVVFHAFFSGIIKNWLMYNESFDLYSQAPALVDNILATLQLQRISPDVYSQAS